MMGKYWKQYAVLIILCSFGKGLFAQYTVNGNASQDACNLYTLTTETPGSQHGSVWNNNKIDLTQSFDFKFDIFLGNHDSPGADGIAFVLQPISTSVGSVGGGLGYDGVSPAVGVTIDTYQNGGNNDPTYDHIAIQLNGDLNHTSANNIAGPVQALLNSPNIEDGAWHSLRVQWDATTKTLIAYIDGTVRVNAIKDFVTDVFGGNPMVYWGFTGSTGGEVNLQRFKIALNPSFHFAPTQKRCVGQPILFLDSTVSFTNIVKFYWDFGDGSPIDSVHLNPTHYFNIAKDYTVVQTVIGADGCTATNTQTVRIGDYPVADFTLFGDVVLACQAPGSNLSFIDKSTVSVGTINNWFWNLDNGITSTYQNPAISYPSPGIKTVTLAVGSSEGCLSTRTRDITITFRPDVDFTFADSVCLGQLTLFSGTVTVFPGDTGTIHTNWAIDNQNTNIYRDVFNPSYTFLTGGNQVVSFSVSVSATGVATCIAAKVKTVYVRDRPHAAIKTPIICPSVPITLQDSSYTTENAAITGYWWDLGNGQFSTQQNPTVTYNTTGTVTIKHVAIDAKGCISDTLTKTITLQQKPISKFGYTTPVCNGLDVAFSDSSTTVDGVINKWSWVYNGAVFGTQQNVTKAFTAGSQTVKLVATNSIGCISDSVSKTFFVNPSPDVTINFKDACKNAVVNFTAVDNTATVTDWKWTFGDGATAPTQNAQHIYTANGTYNVKLIATASNGCFSNSLTKDIVIYGTNAFAGNDTIATAGQPIQLNATGGLSYTWSPANLLSDPTIANPITTLTATQLFSLKAFTPEGCESYDDVLVKIYKGPDIYLPNAFTPNGDGLNDVFKGTPVGIKQFNYLKVFNRWGQLIFSTTDYNYAWDGTWHGEKQANGVYVVLANGIDFKGNIIDKRATVMLIR